MVCFTGGLPRLLMLCIGAKLWRGKKKKKRVCKMTKMWPIYLLRYNICESSIKTMMHAESCYSSFSFTNRHKAFVPSEWIIDRPQIIQDNRMEGYVVCACVCVTPHQYLTSLLAHFAGFCRTNCLLWLSLRGSAARKEKDRAETQGTGL